MFADDTAIMANSEDDLRYLVGEFEREWGEKGLRVNPGKSKMMKMKGRRGVGEGD